MVMAYLVAARSTCLRRKVGCVMVNERGHILSTGYNGVASGQPHCNQHDSFSETDYPFQCEGAFAKSGVNLDGCEAIHAEQNALLQCRDVQTIHTCYTTASPCITCTKLLLNTSCKRVVFGEEYPHARARELWVNSNREWLPSKVNLNSLKENL